jgi:hypothetical protein
MVTVMALEQALGRSLAFIVHPHAAWRILSPKGRAGLVGAYFLAGYAAALTVFLGVQ